MFPKDYIGSFELLPNNLLVFPGPLNLTENSIGHVVKPSTYSVPMSSSTFSELASKSKAQTSWAYLSST